MEVKIINSYNELINNIKDSDRSFLLLYKKGTEKSDCAYDSIGKASENIEDVEIFIADVNVVRDIHTEYSITSAPTLMEFEKTELKNVVKGCHDYSYFKAVFEDAVYKIQAKKSGKTAKSVTVYSTPTCSWCNTLKNYLRTNKIKFSDIDVSKNQSAAEEMVRRSGQQGVPQTLINGEIIVGFDKAKINRLLEIKAN